MLVEASRYSIERGDAKDGGREDDEGAKVAFLGGLDDLDVHLALRVCSAQRLDTGNVEVVVDLVVRIWGSSA